MVYAVPILLLLHLLFQLRVINYALIYRLLSCWH